MTSSAFGWALVAAGIWGAVPLLEKLGLSGSNPTIGVFARTIGVVIGALVCSLWWSPWQGLGKLSLRSFLLLGLGGFLASFIGQLAFYRALKVGDISQVAPIVGAYPLVAALLGWFVLHEPMTAGRVLGTLLVVCGMLLLRR